MAGGERWGRYSFLGTSARTHIQVFDTHVEIANQDETRKIPHDNDPLKVLKELSNGFNPAPVPCLPRFWGGLVGYMTYEMVSFFEKIPNQLPATTPLAHFIIPDELIIFDNIRNTITAVAIAFMDDQPDPDAAYTEVAQRIDNMTEKMSHSLSADSLGMDAELGMPQAEITPKAFIDMVKNAKNYIRSGDVIQTVHFTVFYRPGPKRSLDAVPSPALYQSLAISFLLPSGGYGLGGIFAGNHGSPRKSGGYFTSHRRNPATQCL